MMDGANAERPQPAPQGHKRLAQGFNPGLALRVMPACPPKFGSEGRRRKSGARRVGVLRDTITACVQSTAPKSGACFRAHLVKTPNPGLKPWAILLCPFGACSDRWPHKRGRSNCFST